MIAEEWKYIPGLEEKYEASNFGRIRNAISKNVLNGAIFDTSKHHKSFMSYRMYCLTCFGKSHVFYGHHLIAKTFLGPRPKGQYVRHLNDNGLDNRVENLRYGTWKDNREDAIRNGRVKYRSQSKDEIEAKKIKLKEQLGKKPYSHYNYVKGWKYLSKEEVEQVLYLHASGLKQVDIAKYYGCHYSTISRIVNGSRRKSWQG